jgi:hypothetical protein
MHAPRAILTSVAAASLVAGMSFAAAPAQSAQAGPAAVATRAADTPKGNAGKKHGSDHPVRVMTLNLYLGGSLGKVIDAIATGGDIFAAANSLMDTAIATDFPKRAKWIAKTVRDRDPDIITLNELTDWDTTGALPSYDYLQIFLKALKKQGMNFKTASLVKNADIGLDIGGAKSPVPYTGDYPGCEAGAAVACGWRLKDRDAVLYNTDSKHLKLVKGSAKQGHFADQETYSALGATVDFNRGWASARFKWHGKVFTHMTSHLEVESRDGQTGPPLYGFPSWPSKIQVSQGNELVAKAKQAAKKSGGRVLLSGDFNTDANGYYSPTYRNMTRWFTDTWKQVGRPFGPAYGATCCQMGDLDSSLRLDSGDPTMPTRIDLVLARKAKADRVAILGTQKMQDKQPKWQSDHYFYAADVNLR